MKKGFFLIMICGLVFAFAGLTPAAEESVKQTDKGKKQDINGPEAGEKAVVARVNGVDIPLEALLNMESFIKKQKEQTAETDTDSDKLTKDALDLLIARELMYQKAKAIGMKAEEKDIDLELEKLKTNMGGEEAYQKYLEKNLLTGKDLRAEMERNILLRNIYTKEVTDKVVIPEKDLRAEYDKNKNMFVIPEKIVVTDVVFFLDKNDSKSMKKAEDVLKKLREDKDHDPAKLIPDGSFIVRDLAFENGKEPELREEARKLREGELSGIIITADSVHIIKLDKYSREKQFAFDEVRGVIEANLKTKAIRARFREWKEELKKGAKIEILKPSNPAKEPAK